MTRRRIPAAAASSPPDDDPDPIALPPTDPLSRALVFLERCRMRGFRVGPTLIIGDVTLQVADLWQEIRERPLTSSPSDLSIYQMAGAVDEPAEGTGG